MLLCKTGSQQAVCHCSYTYGDLLFIQVCSDPTQSTAARFRAKCSLYCSVLLCKTGWQQAVCHCSYTYGDLLFIQVCSDPTESTAARFRAKCSLYCSVLLCKTGSQQAVCHCSYTYGDLLFIQVCSDPTESTAARFRANAVSTVQCCSAKQAHSRQCVTAVTPMEICSSYRCAVTKQQSTAARFRARCSFHCSVLLCKTGSQQAVCHCSYTYGDLLFIQVYSDQATKHCSKVQGKNAVSTVLCCSAKQAGSRQSVTAVTPMETIAYGDLLFVQLCSDLATKHCCKVQGKNAVYTVQCCSAKQAGSRQSVTAVTPMETCSSNRCAVTQQKALQQGSGQSAVYTVQCCSAKQAHSRQCVTAVTPMEICSSYRCAVTQQKALQQGSWQNAVYTVQCCSAKQAHSRQCVTAVTPMEICSSYSCAVT